MSGYLNVCYFHCTIVLFATERGMSLSYHCYQINATAVRVTALVFTGNVEACLRRLQWIPGLSYWQPLRSSVGQYPGTQSCSLVDVTLLRSVKSTGARSSHEFQWFGLETGHRDNSSSDRRRNDTYYCFVREWHYQLNASYQNCIFNECYQTSIVLMDSIWMFYIIDESPKRGIMVARGPFPWLRLTEISAWISNYNQVLMCYVIIYPCPNFNC